MKISIKVTGDKKINQDFAALKAALYDINPELKKVSRWILNFVTNDVFQSDGQIISSPWKELKTRTQTEKVRKGFVGKGILERTGDLRRGWKGRIFGNKLIFENKVPYAVYHHEGRGHNPKRKLYKMTGYFERQIYSQLEKELTKKVEKAFNDGR